MGFKANMITTSDVLSTVGLVFKCNVWTRMFEAKNHLLCFIDLRFFALHFTFVLK